MIGRTIKVLKRDPRLVFSIFFPSSGGELVSGLDLYAPCQAEAASLAIIATGNAIQSEKNFTDRPHKTK